MEIENIKDIYYFVSLFSSVIILTLGVMLASMRLPKGKVWTKTRSAQIYLSASFLFLGASNIVEFFYHDSADKPLLLFGITAVISSFQALLITATLLVNIQPSFVKRKIVLKQVVLISACSVVALTCIMLDWVPAMVSFPIILGLYVYQLIAYTILFRKKYAECISTLEEYYDEEQDARLKWIKICFYSALFIGVMGITSSLVGMWLYLTFIVLYTIFYTWIVIQFNNFRLWAEAVVPIVAKENAQEEDAASNGQEPEIPVYSIKELEDKLKIQLDKWVQANGYLKKDESVDDIARLLGTDKNFLRYYFSTHLNTNFRTWRSELRIKEAQRLIREHPEYSLSQIGEITGFNHRGNFYNQFIKIVGISATEYRESVLSEKE